MGTAHQPLTRVQEYIVYIEQVERRRKELLVEALQRKTRGERESLMNSSDREVRACGLHLTSVTLVPGSDSHLQATVYIVICSSQTIDVSGIINDETKVLMRDHGRD